MAFFKMRELSIIFFYLSEGEICFLQIKYQRLLQKALFSRTSYQAALGTNHTYGNL